MINQNKSIFVSNKQTIVIQKLGKMSYEKIDYKIIIDIFLTVTSIILMKINNGAYSARTAHPFQRNGAPFRFKLSKAQQVD